MLALAGSMKARFGALVLLALIGKHLQRQLLVFFFLSWSELPPPACLFHDIHGTTRSLGLLHSRCYTCPAVRLSAGCSGWPA